MKELPPVATYVPPKPHHRHTGLVNETRVPHETPRTKQPGLFPAVVISTAGNEELPKKRRGRKPSASKLPRKAFKRHVEAPRAKKRVRKRKYPEEVVMEARELRQMGMTYKAIAERLSMPLRTVGKWCVDEPLPED